MGKVTIEQFMLEASCKPCPFKDKILESCTYYDRNLPKTLIRPDFCTLSEIRIYR